MSRVGCSSVVVVVSRGGGGGLNCVEENLWKREQDSVKWEMCGKLCSDFFFIVKETFLVSLFDLYIIVLLELIFDVKVCA